MRKRVIQIAVTTVSVIGVLGAGVAAAAQPWANGQTHPSAAVTTQTQTHDRDQLRARDGTGLGKLTNRSGDRDRLRARDGTGPRHAKNQQVPRNADCPYRS